METAALTVADHALLDHARDLNRDTFDAEFLDGAHIVAASVRTTDGDRFDGVSLPASIGRASVCAEPVAIGSAIAAGYSHDDIEACVAVAYPMPDHDAEETRVVPPCGVCREMLADYNPEMRVVVPDEGDHRMVRAGDLLPMRPW
ncbi:MAG: cytidine deaminase [Halolamina sp.]